MKIYICQVCGHIAFNNLPDTCPVCGVEKDNFLQKDAVFKESIQKSPEAEVKHVPAVTVNTELQPYSGIRLYGSNCKNRQGNAPYGRKALHSFHRRLSE